MSYVVYHKSFSPEFLIEEKDYIQYLSTGEWFDRPQINNKGNRDETKRLLSESKSGFGEIKSESERLQWDGGENLRDPNASKREVEANSSGSSRDSKSTKETILEVKKRGRPRRIESNGEQNN